MATLKLNIKQKVPLVLESKTVSSLRGENNEQIVPVLFQNGTGQIVVEGTILYEEGIEGEEGYLRVENAEGFELNDNGQFDIKIISYPNIYQNDKSIYYLIDNSTGILNLNYNSKPETKDFVLEKGNRVEYVFTASDFLNNITDFDGDDIIEIALKGNVTGFTFDSIDYVEWDFISINDITLGKLKYTATDTDTAYEQVVEYIAKDSKGFTSEPVP